MQFNIQPSASMEIARIAEEKRKKGIKVYSLSVGDTHFSPPFDLVEKAKNIPSEYSHYSGGAGIPELREEIAQYYNNIYSATEVLVMPGLKQGLYYALAALKGKVVCVLEPAWLGYKSLALLTGKEYVAVNTNKEAWLEQLRKTYFDILIICSPNNPDGKILTETEIDTIVDIANRKKSWVITDEIYELYDYRKELTFNPIKKLHGAERVIVGNGLSKSHAMTGFRLGYLLTKDKELVQVINNIHQNIATCAPVVSQYLALGFTDYLPQVTIFKNYYSQNIKLVTDILPHAAQYEPQGGFYFFIDLKQYSVSDSEIFCRKALAEANLGLVPGSAYGSNLESYIRLSISVDKQMLQESMSIFKCFLEGYKY